MTLKYEVFAWLIGVATGLFVLFLTLETRTALRNLEARVKVTENRIIAQITPRTLNNERRIINHQDSDPGYHISIESLERLVNKLTSAEDTHE